jgi:Family of unknown function (DUF6866) N-terminal domain/Family of unknown function (DUF6866) C-terminal domain
MVDIASLTRQVRRNCTLSDARFAGHYSVCGLVMRLRDLYKWEHSLAPYEEHEASQVLDWIGRKETEWEALQESEFDDLVIDGRRIDPFDTLKINRLVEPLNLFYGAGYAHSLKPSFLLAAIDSKSAINGHPVVLLDKEMARDLLTLPAFTQDDTIVVRQSAAGLYVWDRMLYLNQSGRPFFRFALSACGIAERDFGSLRRCLPAVTQALHESFLHHEIGELSDRCFSRDIWRDIIAALPHTPTELLVRTVKDILADTGPKGTLRHIGKNQQTAALGFYAAFLDGLGKKLFPEIRAAVVCFMRDGDWPPVAAMVSNVHQKAETMAHTIIDLFMDGTRHHNPAWVNEALNRMYIEPLTT